MNRFLLVISIVFSFQLANAGDQCDGVFSDASQILVEVLNSPTACEAFAKAALSLEEYREHAPAIFNGID